MHPAAMDYVRSVLERVPIPKGPVIEIGGRNINGTVRPLFDGVGPYVSLDLYDGAGVDFTGDVCTLDPKRTARAWFGRSRVTCVVCCEVLEHANDPGGICRWAHRVLATVGVLILTAASPTRVTHSGIDGGPLHPGEHYRGVSTTMLRRWLTPFSSATVTQSDDGLDVYAVAWKRR